jgi:hypothetical protein
MKSINRKVIVCPPTPLKGGLFSSIFKHNDPEGHSTYPLQGGRGVKTFETFAVKF